MSTPYGARAGQQPQRPSPHRLSPAPHQRAPHTTQPHGRPSPGHLDHGHPAPAHPAPGRRGGPRSDPQPPHWDPNSPHDDSPYDDGDGANATQWQPYHGAGGHTQLLPRHGAADHTQLLPRHGAGDHTQLLPPTDFGRAPSPQDQRGRPDATRPSSAADGGVGGGLRATCQVVALLLLLGGMAGYFLGTNEVRVVDDGASSTVRTYASTVRGLLHHAGLALAKHDTVSPAPRAAIGAGDKVVVKRGRPVTLTVDGKTERRWVTYRTVKALVSTLDLKGEKLRVSASADTVIPREGMRLTVRTHKRLTLIADGEKTKLTTYAATPAELLPQQELELKGRDEVKPKLHHSLAGVNKVRVFRVTVKTRTVTAELGPPVKVKKNPDWMVDQKATVDPGKPGEARQKVELIYRDGKFSERKVLSSETLTKPEPALVHKGAKQYPEDDTGLNWDALAECESGGNPRSVSSNGQYHGLYQFNVPMWQRMGGIGVPSEATPREQTYRAILLYKAAGADQWPHCGPRLFS
ncbi:MAG: ubiquitin-like domain-containing protein [Micromonosporaceae bacterium]